MSTNDDDRKSNVDDSASRASTIIEAPHPPPDGDELLDPNTYAENEKRELKEDPHLVTFTEGDPENPKVSIASTIVSTPAIAPPAGGHILALPRPCENLPRWRAIFALSIFPYFSQPST